MQPDIHRARNSTMAADSGGRGGQLKEILSFRSAMGIGHRAAKSVLGQAGNTELQELSTERNGTE